MPGFHAGAGIALIAFLAAALILLRRKAIALKATDTESPNSASMQSASTAWKKDGRVFVRPELLSRPCG